MSKKINFSTINATTVQIFSDYNVAHQTLKTLQASYKVNTKKVKDEIAGIQEARTKAIEEGKTADEAISMYSLESYYADLNKLEIEYKKACEPHNKAKKECLAMFSDELYIAYRLSQLKGLSAIGKFTIGKNEYTVTKSLKSNFVDFLELIGAKNADNETATNKFAEIMVARVSGSKKCNKGDEYISAKSKSQFNDIVMLAFLQYLVIEKGVLTQNEDYTLAMTVYDAE